MKKNILIYLDETTDRLDDTTIAAERKYYVNAVNYKKKIRSTMQSEVFSMLMA